ncbi:hypothetical protein AALP_AA1G018000 [Arabis alpina]|uniref:Potassium channel domain-containing protein n=1 Tax=Arabis alpina TaxID=50452 RepID=A0A087HKF9_ARAAL|nr:hypothetical protein AALP_AA1G018000 [Arabis alpina]
MEESLISPDSRSRHESSPETPETSVTAVSTTVADHLRRNWIITLAIIGLCLYIAFVVCIFCFYRDQYSGSETHPIVDAFYFSVVTMSTVGYGDIVPLTKTTKIISIGFVIISIVLLDILINWVVDHVLALQETAILALIATRNRAIRAHIVDVENDGKMKMVWKLGLALCVVVTCIVVGACVLCFGEELGFLDSVYLSVMSVTTVGYGDETFKTVGGRIFAVVWLVLSTVAMACLFIYFAQIRVDGKVMELPVSESEFVVSKLKECGKISEDDIKLFVSEYEKLDGNTLRKITSQQLLEC